jgi:hypothetical protein
MPRESDRIAELEDEVARLMREVDRYRTAAEDTMQQLDWCIGYFAGANKSRLAQGLSANRAHIRRQLMRRAGEEVPVKSS